MKGEESLREKRKRETRELIQRAARRLMVEYGYEKMTMRALAKAAGVGLGTIGLHFKGKKSLLLSTFYDEIEREFLMAFEAMPREGSLKDKLMSIVGTMYGYYGEHTIFLGPVAREALFATGEWRGRFDDQLHEMLGLVAGLVERHKELGEVRADVFAPHVAMAGWCLYLNVLIDGLNSEVFDVDAQVAKVEPLLNVLLGGVLAGNDKSGQAAEGNGHYCHGG